MKTNPRILLSKGTKIVRYRSFASASSKPYSFDFDYRRLNQNPFIGYMYNRKRLNQNRLQDESKSITGD
ncbi:hypothetical protein HanPSC8_Chr09g0392091 [Helianthus annuus]|nr:hypothetical protein HanPSC8_Chr09g0392091 [Helianthus annuus]